MTTDGEHHWTMTSISCNKEVLMTTDCEQMSFISCNKEDLMTTDGEQWPPFLVIKKT